MSQRARVLSVIGLSILPVVALAAFSIWTQLSDSEMRITRERVALARAAAFATESFVEGHLSTVRSLALHPVLARKQPARELSVFLRMVAADHPEWSGVGINGFGGQMHVAAVPDAIDELVGEGAPGSPVIVISVPLGYHDQHGDRGTLTVPIAIRALSDRLARSIGGRPMDIVVVGKQGRAYVGTDGSRVRLLTSGNQPHARMVLERGAGSFVTDAAGVPVLAAYAPVSPYGWGVILTEPVSSVFAPARRGALERAGVLLAGLVAAALLGWHLGGRLGHFYQRAVHARGEAEAAHAGLQSAVAARDRFLATLSHELRNPLAPISNALAILDHPEAAHAAAARTIIRRQVANMVRLIDDLLEISRITTGKLRLHQQKMDIALAIGDAVETVAPALRQKGHTLEIRTTAEPAYVHADRTRLAQVLGNLLNNAIKYTQPAGRIDLVVEALDEHVTLSVKDTGCGIPPVHLERIFEMFEQLDLSSNGKQDGLGVGLAVVKQLVEMHGGTVSAHSQGRNMGSEFLVRLPRAR